MPTAVASTVESYDLAWKTAVDVEYPEVDALEQRLGCAVDRERLNSAARVLACPLKINPPHWAHGRVIFSAVSAYVKRLDPFPFTRPIALLDVGSAKGFSALCMLWAVADLGHMATVTSVDVIDPKSRVRRNTVAELDGLLTLEETLAQWPESQGIRFERSTGIDWLAANKERINVAFIDGKHDGHVVRQEGKLLASRQHPGDLSIFDDCQIPAVSQAVVSLQEFWKFEYVKATPREYAIGWRR